MKKCRRCSNPATLHITEIHDGNAVAVHLCDTCARDYLDDAQEDDAYSPAAELAAKLESLANEDPDAPALTCSNCGITFNEFREHGRLGCPCCYDDFRSDLMPLLENIHEETLHTGKRPKRSPGQTEDLSRLIRLRARQRDAITREDYEAAASLRDEIAGIEAALRGGSPEEPSDTTS